MYPAVIASVITTIILGAGYVYHGKLVEDRDKQTIKARDAHWQQKFDDANKAHRETSAAIVQAYITVDDDTLDDEFSGVYPGATGTDCECAGELQTHTIGPYTGPDQFKDSEDRFAPPPQNDTIVYDGQIIYHDITSDTCDDFENQIEINACKELLQ